MDSQRIKKLQQRLAADCLLIDHPLDLVYLTGVAVSLGRLVAFPDRACFFVDERYIEKAKREASCEARLKNGLFDYLKPAHKIGFDAAFLTCEGFQGLQEKLPGKEWVPFSRPVKELRALKEPKEIEALRKAAHLTAAGYRHIAALLKEGVAEEDLALEFEIYCRRRGASRLSFDPIVAFGENSAFPHHRAGKARLKKDQIVLLDLGAMVDGYAGDMTRVVFFGSPDPQLEKDSLLVKKAHSLAIAQVRPHIRFGDLDQIARDYLRKEGVEGLFTHGLSHGVGLDVHEFPTLRREGGDADLKLAPSMVFTVEPGLYRPGLGGVRHEDTVLVTETGVENLSSGKGGER